MLPKDDRRDFEFDASLAHLVELLAEHAEIADPGTALRADTKNKIRAAMGERRAV